MTSAISKKPSSESPILSGNFAPVVEENSISQLVVTGKIPEELQGLFVRIGPNPLPAPNPKSYHWFMGSGMVHGVRLRDGKAHWYKNNFVLDDSLANF